MPVAIFRRLAQCSASVRCFAVLCFAVLCCAVLCCALINQVRENPVVGGVYLRLAEAFCFRSILWVTQPRPGWRTAREGGVMPCHVIPGRVGVGGGVELGVFLLGGVGGGSELVWWRGFAK